MHRRNQRPLSTFPTAIASFVAIANFPKETFMQKFILNAALCLLLGILAACGGGGSSADNSTSTSQPSGKNGPAQNQIAVTVGPNAYNARNMLYTSVIICVPGTSNCQTIDNIQVDTASNGLRVMASALTLPLPPSTAAAGGTLTECSIFGPGAAWGPVVSADIKLAGEIAANAPIQLVADPSFAGSASAQCASNGVANLDTPAAMHANGVLGIGIHTNDCGANCASSTSSGQYFGCLANASSCAPSTVPESSQVANPISLFATDNNGASISLPSVPATGSSTVTGTLTFGIDTQANNALGSAKIYSVDNYGNFVTVFNGKTLTAFLDSGSNGLFFTDDIPQCSGNSFYCPSSTQSYSAVIQGRNGNSTTVDFNVANAVTMTGNGMYAMDSFAADAGMPTLFDWGLPFYYGRTVFMAIAGKKTAEGVGPFAAF
ncbi:Heavy-chain fibroin [Paraburkholderia piptadeniae]|uniref:Heavy-chain fibroin n=2 Tax=Paraburkholderia piptadeniae TaxID=1701573 RepID=A0A1N7SIF9_9BURK|nr:Heavy-chain fibroin [Paraburkholderia piptadeniae]